MSKVTYNELDSVQISDARFLVISECSEGGYTLGQKMIITDGDKKMEMFLKGAIHINDIESLKSIGKCIENIIKTEKTEKK